MYELINKNTGDTISSHHKMERMVKSFWKNFGDGCAYHQSEAGFLSDGKPFTDQEFDELEDLRISLQYRQ